MAKPKTRYDLTLLAADMASRGWMNTDLARAAAVSDMTVSRFFSGECQTARTAKKFAEALGRSVARYIVRPQKTEQVA